MSISLGKILAASPGTTRGQPTQLSSDGQRLAYASGKSIFVRSIDHPELAKQYTAHTSQTTVARFSPSGFYIASGDVSGKVHVWDPAEAVKPRSEYSIISGRINDIAWDADSQRIIAVGDGRERFGHCITVDTGNSVGEISGHSGIINSISIRQQRPLRAATVSDDSSMVILNGAPFKFASKVGGMHKGYVYAVAFSPDGNTLVSVGADKKIQLYDGKTGEPTKHIGEGEHKGSIFSVSWASDSKRFCTSSADRTVKIWDVESGQVLRTWAFGASSGPTNPSDQQVGVVWPAGRSDGLIISLNLAGDLTYLIESEAESSRVIYGHNRSITALGVRSGVQSTAVWTGSFDGRVCSWNTRSGEAETIDGLRHTNQVTAFAIGHKQACSVGWDDMLRIIELCGQKSAKESQKLDGQPKGIASADDESVFVVSDKGIQIYHGEKLVGQLPTKNYSPLCITASKSMVAVGDDKHSVHIYAVDGKHTLSSVTTIDNSTAPVTALAFSPMGDLLAAGNASGKISVYDTKSWEVVTDRWSAHTARILSLAWNASGTHAVSGSIDTNLHIWSLKSPGTRIKAANAHKDMVSGVCWTGELEVASVGGDAAVKMWNITGLYVPHTEKGMRVERRT